MQTRVPSLCRRAVPAAIVPLASLLVLLTLAQFAAAQSSEQEDRGRVLYREMCASCHNIGGGDKTGPDLKAVTDRRSDAWLTQMMADPAGWTSSDPEAQKLDEQYPATMALPRQLTPYEIECLIAFLRAEGMVEKSEFHAPETINRVATPEDIIVGRELFVGVRALANGGPSCISCHHVDGLGGLGGGTLAVDLTGAHGRLTTTNPDGLTQTIATPGFPVMADVFSAHPVTISEAFQLNAYLKDVGQSAQRQQQSASSGELFLIVSLFGAAFALAGFDLLWRKRFSGVRKPLVGGRP